MCLSQEGLDVLLPFGKTEIIKGVEESSLYPTPCVFTPTIYFLDLKEKPSRYSAEVGQNALREQKARGSRDLKISIGLLYIILRPTEPMVSLCVKEQGSGDLLYMYGSYIEKAIC